MSKGTETRNRIIAKAAPLFNLKGFEGCSMQDIVEAAVENVYAVLGMRIQPTQMKPRIRIELVARVQKGKSNGLMSSATDSVTDCSLPCSGEISR